MGLNARVERQVVEFSFLSTETARETPLTFKASPWISSSRSSNVLSNPGTEKIFELPTGETYTLAWFDIDGN